MKLRLFHLAIMQYGIEGEKIALRREKRELDYL
jgi:hypothetical protein